MINPEAYSWRTEFGGRLDGRVAMVTGASGFIGRHLCGAMAELGARVHAVDRLQGSCQSCVSHTIDLSELAAVRALLDQIRPEFVFHLAGNVNASQDRALVLPMLRDNLLATVHLLESVPASCRRVVVAGSCEELGAFKTGGAPTSPYAAAKAAAGSYAQMYRLLYGLSCVVVRLFMNYGPGQQSDKVIPYVISSLLRGQAPLLGSGRRVCDFVYVRDVVRGLLTCALETVPQGLVDLGTGQGTSLREAVELLVSLIGGHAEPRFGAIADRRDETNMVAGAAGTILPQWQPLWTLRQGLDLTVQWYRAQRANQ